MNPNELPPMEVNLMVNGMEVRGKLHEDLIVGSGSLSVHMDEVSAKFAYWGMLKVMAYKEEKDLKNRYRTWLAEKKKEVCSVGKYNSETAKEEAVFTKYTDEFAMQQKYMLEAEYRRGILEVIEKAWEMKANMLVSLGANARQEANMDQLKISEWNSRLQK
jgi:hypothetical protein